MIIFKIKNKNCKDIDNKKLYDMINFCENKYDCRHIALCNYFWRKT